MFKTLDFEHTPIELIEWEDSTVIRGWGDLEVALSIDNISCYSIGYVIERGSNLYVIPHVAPNEDDRHTQEGCMIIPLSAVRRRTTMVASCPQEPPEPV